jgi:hypothetical protein
MKINRSYITEGRRVGCSATAGKNFDPAPAAPAPALQFTNSTFTQKEITIKGRQFFPMISSTLNSH